MNASMGSTFLSAQIDLYPTQTDRSVLESFSILGIHVFAEEDTSEQPIPQFSRCSGDPAAFAERLKRFVTSRGVRLEYTEQIRPAHGMLLCRENRVAAGDGASRRIFVLAHEVEHLLLHLGERHQR